MRAARSLRFDGGDAAANPFGPVRFVLQTTYVWRTSK